LIVGLSCSVINSTFNKKELLRITKSKHFIESKLGEETALNPVPSDFERDDDDPLSIRSLSTTFLAIIIAFLTVLLPSISVFLGRPLSQSNEIISNYSIKKDGS